LCKNRFLWVDWKSKSYETEPNTPSNTLASFSVGGALLIGFEAKIEIKPEN
jgi:hypothetical protein